MHGAGHLDIDTADIGLKGFAGVARVPFLTLPVVLVAVGASAAAYDGAFSWLRTLLAFLLGLGLLQPL